MKNIETTLETGLTLREFAKKYSNMTIFAMTPSGYVVITPDMIPELDTMKTIRVSAGDSETEPYDAEDVLTWTIVRDAVYSEKRADLINVFCVRPEDEVMKTGITLREFAKRYSAMTIIADTYAGRVFITPDMVDELDTMKAIRVNADSETFLMDDADFVLSNVVTRAGVKENDWTRVYVFVVEPDGESLSSAEGA